MKKLLVLLMVLGLVSSANAALSISLSATTVAVGGDVVLSVSSSDTEPWAGFLILSEDTTNWPDPIHASYDGSMTTSGIGDQGHASPSGLSAWDLQAAGTSVLPVAGNQFVINVKGVQVGTIYVNLADTSYTNMFDDMALVVTPEPMTIVLLGLGGLFLRRRK